MRAVVDACVLYPTILRETVMGVARAGLIAPVWSDRLHEEWARTAARRGGPEGEVIARGEIVRLNAIFPDAITTADPAREAQLWLPDPGDVHVLATAILAGADTILTLNLRDFPKAELVPHGVEAIHPDAALYGLWLAQPEMVGGVIGTVHATAERLSGETLPLKPLLKRARLPRLAKAIARDGAVR